MRVHVLCFSKFLVIESSSSRQGCELGSVPDHVKGPAPKGIYLASERSSVETVRGQEFWGLESVNEREKQVQKLSRVGASVLGDNTTTFEFATRTT